MSMSKKARIEMLERELEFTKKRLSNLSINVQSAFAIVSNRPDVDTLTNKQLLDCIFEELVRIK